MPSQFETTTDRLAATARLELAALRLLAYRAIDPAFVVIADGIAAIIARHTVRGPDGMVRIKPSAETIVLTEIDDLVRQSERAMGVGIARSIVSAEQLAERHARLANVPIPLPDVRDRSAQSQLIATRVDAAIVRLLGQVERVIGEAVALGSAATTVVTRLTQFFDPAFTPYRDVTGVRVNASVPGAMTDWPAASGMALSGIRLIASRELTDAHRARMETIAQKAPGHGLKYSTGPGHRGRDICDRYAEADSGYGPGVYAGSAPAFPHVGCGCSVVAVPLNAAIRERQAA